MSGLTPNIRKLFNVAKRTGRWAFTCCNKEGKKAKPSSWRRYCQEITDVPGCAKLMKIMAKQATNGVSTIKLPEG